MTNEERAEKVSERFSAYLRGRNGTLFQAEHEWLSLAIAEALAEAEERGRIKGLEEARADAVNHGSGYDAAHDFAAARACYQVAQSIRAREDGK